ncbi:MAG: uL15 family ribosomal protein [Candidatus Lokiarchaeota archaeon]|nr:uL15 family ribosomal protein [Candidatus Lokiarchaeota archaeon]
MTIKYKKKIRDKRGTRTIGYGNVGQHRKSGQRVGKGKTTQWKKAMKSYYLKQKELGFPDPDWEMGKTGFKRPQDIIRISKVNSINIKDLDLKLDEYVTQEKATKSGNAYVINLADLNIQKILGRGEINKKVNVTVKKASKNAEEKIKKAGGKVTYLLSKK